MKKLTYLFVLGFVLIGTGFCQEPAASDNAMTLDDLRQYFELLHMKEADAQSIRMQMHAKMATFPEWWPSDVAGAMTDAMLSVDLPPLEYPFVKSCMSSADMQALIALFRTAEGQTYLSQTVLAQKQAEASGASPVDARRQQPSETPIPAAAMDQLTPDQRDRVIRVLKGNAAVCMNSGFSQAVPSIAQVRKDLAMKVVQDRQAELQLAKAKHDVNQGSPKE